MGRRLALLCAASIATLTLSIFSISSKQVISLRASLCGYVGAERSDAIAVEEVRSTTSSTSKSPVLLSPQPLNGPIPFLPLLEDKKKLDFPPWEDLLTNETRAADENNIIGDVRFLLDVAVLGHAKCATSFIMRWLSDHSQVRMWKQEVCDLYDLKPAKLASKLYHDFPPEDANTLRGFKCPGHFTRSSLRYFRRYFGRARLIVGVRHPVRWFESYYNFRNRHPRAPTPLPDADQLIGECTSKGQGVCTARAAFHQNLAMFGKTNVSFEQEWLHLPGKYELSSPIDNPVFIYDVAQLYDSNSSRLDQFKVDLQHFLGLEGPLVDVTNVTVKEDRRKSARMDICEPRYDNLRKELLEMGAVAGDWIRRFFIASPTVYVSDQAHFESILEEWKIDPCANTTTLVA